MINALTKAIRDALSPGLRKIILSALAMTFVLYTVLLSALWQILAHTSFFETGWLERISDIFGEAMAVVLSLLLFPAVATAMISIFAEHIVDALDKRHNPQAGPPRDIGLGETIKGTLVFAFKAIALNIAVLPLYLIAPLIPFVFYSLNGYLLSFEYFELVALRRHRAAEVHKLFAARKKRYILAGALVAFAMTVPVVNILTPVLATAFIYHLYQAQQQAGA